MQLAPALPSLLCSLCCCLVTGVYANKLALFGMAIEGAWVWCVRGGAGGQGALTSCIMLGGGLPECLQICHV